MVPCNLRFRGDFEKFGTQKSRETNLSIRTVAANKLSSKKNAGRLRYHTLKLSMQSGNCHTEFSLDASESVGAELDQTQIVRYKPKVHTFFHHQSANAHNSALHESRGDAKSEVEHEVPLEDVSDGVVS